MAAVPDKPPVVPPGGILEAFSQVSDAVATGLGLPEVTRTAGRALGASVALTDPSGRVLASACASPDDERAVLSGAQGSAQAELRVAELVVGQLRYRPRGVPPPPVLVRMTATLLALEVERSVAPERASEAAVNSFVADLLERRLAGGAEIALRARELGAELSGGGVVVLGRAHPQQPEEGDWRSRVLQAAERGARGAARGSLAAQVEMDVPGGAAPPSGLRADLAVIVPGPEPELGARVAAALQHELSALTGYVLAVARGRHTADPAGLARSGAEALLALNVAEARGQGLLAFEETGAYRLLLPAMSEDPAELWRFYEETLERLVAYDEQYETELVHTLDTYLERDGNVAGTAQVLFTHRHTIRYRLDRIRELVGWDVGSSDGRERLSLGLKAMRVLGIAPPRGPALERGAEGGRVPREEKDR